MLGAWEVVVCAACMESSRVGCRVWGEGGAQGQQEGTPVGWAGDQDATYSVSDAFNTLGVVYAGMDATCGPRARSAGGSPALEWLLSDTGQDFVLCGVGCMRPGERLCSGRPHGFAGTGCTQEFPAVAI
ncbi:hypothetical protein GCM10023090_03350 [Acidovorax lacteus]|uniref:Uncharacterized protein n=1 Tax=Acidovorax lacteus TaxID=1924988 RepID=A0ABP8KZ13_9BURK